MPEGRSDLESYMSNLSPYPGDFREDERQENGSG